jgi:uncharacterized OB-fold protein
MALREYKCEGCGVTEEVIVRTSDHVPPFKVCLRCGSQSRFVEFSRFGIARSSFSESPIDIKIGADAERKWAKYHEDIAARNKVRKETGSLGLTEVHEGQYEPISEERKSERARVYEVAERTGLPSNPEMDAIH